MRTTHYAITMHVQQQLRCKCGSGGTEINDDVFDTVLQVEIFPLGSDRRGTAHLHLVV